MTKKIKVLTISDMPLSPSGVGTQTKYVIEALLKTGRYEIVSFGGAIKHPKYEPIVTKEYGDKWKIFPVDNFGTKEMLRSFIRNEKPDILWFMTDPRFYGWLWNMEDEVRPLLPMVYYHVWDNYPYPKFNKVWYESNDMIATISKVTSDIVKTVAPNTDEKYLPHAVNEEAFKIHDPEMVKEAKLKNFPAWDGKDRVLFFWNNRNARRKQSGSLIWWFKDFLDEVGHDKACLLMHTEPHDPNGPNLESIIEELGLNKGQVLFSKNKMLASDLGMMYNMADCTVNISDAEGFGLATLESLSCGTPIIVNMTGGLQEQVTDGEEWFGVGIEPTSRAVIGSQEVPYIYEDRISKEDFVNALKEMFYKTEEERRSMGQKGAQHVQKNYNFKNFEEQWVEVMDSVYEKYGSWSTRKKYKPWRIEKV